jgi:hypothetical protein
MPRKGRDRFDRSPLRRRLETAVQLAALTFFVVLGLAIYRDVSEWRHRCGGPSTLCSTEARLNRIGPGDAKPREPEPVPAGPNKQTPNAPPPGEARQTGSDKPALGAAPAGDMKLRGGEPVAANPSKPAPETPPRSETKPSEETTGSIKSAPKIALLTPVLLDCREGSPTFWQFANVELIDSASTRTLSPVTSCRISPAMSSPVTCQNAVIVGLGMASSKGIDTIESTRALHRGTNLASALKKDLQARCAADVTVSAYVLNLGRYGGEQQRDEPDQRKVIALVATGSDDADEAATEVVATYTKSDPKIAHYPICELYKLNSAGQPTLVSTQRKICGDQSGSTVSQR